MASKRLSLPQKLADGHGVCGPCHSPSFERWRYTRAGRSAWFIARQALNTHGNQALNNRKRNRLKN